MYGSVYDRGKQRRGKGRDDNRLSNALNVLQRVNTRAPVSERREAEINTAVASGRVNVKLTG